MAGAGPPARSLKRSERSVGRDDKSLESCKNPPFFAAGESTMIVGTVRETLPGERRVAIVPDLIPGLQKAGIEVLIEAGAGIEAGFTDEAYTNKGAKIA